MSDENNDDDDLLEVLGGLAVGGGLLWAGWKLVEAFVGSGRESEEQKSRNEAQNLYQQAQSYEQQGLYSQAWQAVDSALKKDSSYAPALNYAAWLVAIAGEDSLLDQARQRVDKAIALTKDAGDRAIYRDTLAEVYIRLNDIDAAIVEFKHALDLNSEMDGSESARDYGANFRLGWCYACKGDLVNATLSLEKALGYNPHNPLIYWHAATIHFRQNHLDTAIGYFQNAIRLASTWNFNYPKLITTGSDQLRQQFLSICWGNIGVAYYRAKRDPDSRRAHEESFKALPNPTALINLAALAAREKDGAGLLRYLEQGIPLLQLPQDSGLVSYLLHDQDFEAERSRVLQQLLASGKLDPWEYERQSQVIRVQSERTETLKTQTITNISSQSVQLNQPTYLPGAFSSPSSPGESMTMNNPNVNTGGGNYAGRDMDNRGAISNVRTKLDNVTQQIGAMPVADQTAKQELSRLVDQLRGLLEQVPPDKAADATAVAERLDNVVTEASKPNPDREEVEYQGNRLKKAAENIAQVMPTVLAVATQIVQHIVQFVK